MLSMRTAIIRQWCCTCKLCGQTSRQYSPCFQVAVPSACKESTGSKPDEEVIHVTPVQHLMQNVKEFIMEVQTETGIQC